MLKSEIEKHGYFCKLQSIEAMDLSCLSEDILDNHVILGFPVYGSNAPFTVQKFIKNLPTVTNNSLSVFATHAFASGDSAFFVGNQLMPKGYVLKNTKHFIMPNNLHLPNYRFTKPKNGSDINNILKRAEKRISIFAKEITSNGTYVCGDNPPSHFIGKLQRKHLVSMINKASSLMKVDSTTCINCNLCQKVCPTSNIDFSKGKYIFSSNCTLCLRCYSQCPKCAINFGDENKDTSKYPRYKGPFGFNPLKLIK